MPSALAGNIETPQSKSSRWTEITDNQAREWIDKSKLERNYKTATDFFVQK